MILTTQDLVRATRSSLSDAEKYVDHLNNAMARFEIDSPARVAAFLATVSVESNCLRSVKEDLFYRDATRLAQIYKRAFKSPAEAAPYVANPRALGDLLYKGYFGRGLIQLTWRENYQRASNDLGVDFVGNPDLVCTPQFAALTAAWFWAVAGCNEPADQGDMDTVTLRVNGPKKLHLAERTALAQEIMTWLG